MPWKMDPSHSQITFTIRHMMISNVHGRFERFSANVNADEQNPTASSIEVQMEAASIDTREERRDGHLRSPDFLNAEKFPYLTFKSKRIEMLDDSHGRLIGDLTIRDVTREVVLDMEYSGQMKNPYGKLVAGFTAAAKINRKDWDLTWNLALETGGWLVGDIINVDIEFELVKEPEAEKAAAS